jgi:hypothetical protein
MFNGSHMVCVTIIAADGCSSAEACFVIGIIENTLTESIIDGPKEICAGKLQTLLWSIKMWGRLSLDYPKN